MRVWVLVEPVSYDCSFLMSLWVVFLGSHCWWSVQVCSLGLPKFPEGDTFRIHPRRECTSTTSLLWENVYILRVQYASGVGCLHLCSVTRDRSSLRWKVSGLLGWRSGRVPSCEMLEWTVPGFQPFEPFSLLSTLSFVLKYLIAVKFSPSVSGGISLLKSPERAPHPQPFQSWHLGLDGY